MRNPCLFTGTGAALFCVLSFLSAPVLADEPDPVPASGPAVPKEEPKPVIGTSDAAPPPAPPEATQAEAEAEKKKEEEPFAFGDFTWLNGNSRQTKFPLETEAFTGQFMTDANYTFSASRPKDHSLVGSTTSGRTNEVQLSHIGVGGDFHYDNVRGRIMTQFGLYATTTVRNDASPSRGQGDLANAYRYVTEVYGGYPINALNGINLDAGIFMSYLGLCSYYD